MTAVLGPLIRAFTIPVITADEILDIVDGRSRNHRNARDCVTNGVSGTDTLSEDSAGKVP